MAYGAGMVGCFDLFNARSASFVTTAAEEVRIAERKQTHRTLERIRRRVYEIAVVSPQQERSASVVVGTSGHRLTVVRKRVGLE